MSADSQVNAGALEPSKPSRHVEQCQHEISWLCFGNQ